MAKLTRVTAKIFGETADATLADPEIGQFGSAKAGTYNGTGDIATIQSLAAWSNGWIDAVTPTQQFPPLPEMTGVHKVLSQQIAYTLQQGMPEWDSATTYYTNGFCSKAGKIYISQSDNNLNNDPESDTVNWNEFVSGGTRNIGEIVTSTTPLTDAGLHLLDGSLLQYGSYKDVIDHYADLYDSGDYTAIFETEANWQASVTTYGVCGKFVYDSINNTLRLPKYSNKIYTSSISSTAPVKGNGKTLGLTNGGSNIGIYAGVNGLTYNNSATYGANVGTSTSGATIGNNTSLGITTDGTNSGIIADLANITTSLDGYYYVVIANTTKTQIQVDIDEIATDLNGKADVDLTNVNNSGTSKVAGWAMPSTTYDDLTLGASGSTYTAPANGYFTLEVASQTVADGGIIFNNLNNGMCICSRGSTTNNSRQAFIPASKNDTVYLFYDGTLNINYLRFIYAVGSESEA